MTTPKKPADHKPKVEKPKAVKTDTGWDITHLGVTVTVPRAALDDLELLDDLNKLDNGAAQVLPQLLRRLIGEDGYRAAIEALRDPVTARIPLAPAAQYIKDIFGAVSPES